jgi:hypothetical protein
MMGQNSITQLSVTQGAKIKRILADRAIFFGKT